MTNHGQAMTENLPALSPRQKQLANLKPPWKKGQAINPGGRRKDGKANAKQILGTEAYRNALNAYLAQPGRLDQLAAAMVSLALEGNAPAIQHVFQRLDPIKDDASGRKVLEGLTLEISRDGVKLQLPGSNTLSDKDLSASSLPSVEVSAPCALPSVEHALQLPSGEQREE